MDKLDKLLLILATSVFLLFSELSPGIADIYQWDDFSKPFKRMAGPICAGRTNQIEVSLPDSLKSNESVRLIVDMEVDATWPGRPYLIVNNFSRDPYRIRFYEKSPIAIKTEHLKSGINRFSFHNDANR